MGKDNLMKLSGNIALVSLCVNVKGHGHSIKMRVAMPFFTRIVDFPEGKGLAALIFTPLPCPFRFIILGALGIKVKKGSLRSCEP